MSVATYFGVNEIITAFEAQASKPYFSMWVKNALVLENTTNDIETAKQKLSNKINDYLKADFNEIFVLKLHNRLPKTKDGNYNMKEDSGTLLYCQPKKESKQINGIDSGLFPIYNLIEKQNEIITALTSKVNALESEEEETDEQIGSNEEILLDKINGIVNSPLGAIASTYLPRLLDRLIPPTKQVAGIAGTEPTDLEATINILFSKGVTLEHLQKLAAMPEAKIKMLLTML